MFGDLMHSPAYVWGRYVAIGIVVVIALVATGIIYK